MHFARRSKLCWLAVLATITLAAFFFREGLLRTAGSFLVAERAAGDFEYVLVLGGDRRFDEAARRYRENPARRILLICPPPDRVEALGILPSEEALARRELAARQVPATAVETLSIPLASPWTAARALSAWLNRRPGARVLVLCERFHSRYQGHILAAVLPGQQAERVFLCGLADRRYDETNWWQSRTGAKSLFYGYVALAYVGLRGEHDVRPARWNPDRYEAQLRALAGAGP